MEEKSINTDQNEKDVSQEGLGVELENAMLAALLVEPSIEVANNAIQDNKQTRTPLTLPRINEKNDLPYITSIKIERSCKNLNHFTWNNIPMFSVITGTNGIGKTALLRDISQGFENIFNKQQFSVDLSFRKDIDPTDIQLFSFSSSESHVQKSTDTHVAEQHLKKFNAQLEDLKNYIKSKSEALWEHNLQFPELKEIYEICIKEIKSNQPQIKFTDGHEAEAWKNKALKEALENQLGIHIAIYGKAQEYGKYLLENRKCTLALLNSYLEEKGFKYILSMSSFYQQSQKNKLESLRFQQAGKTEAIDITYLSPGEQLEFLMLLWLFDKTQIKHNSSAILLLDEPDAHMHPNLVKKFLDTIQYKIVGELGIQVMMTTHNPTTISLVPKKNIYIMTQGAQKVEIEEAATKSQANQCLTGNLVYVHEPFKLVFVEAADDARFYQLIQKQLVEKEVIYPACQLLFKSHNNKRSHDRNSSRDVVEGLVEKCVKTGDEDKSLKDFIFGLVDGDNKGKSLQPNIKTLERYALENYVYDPVHIFFALQWKKKNTEPFKSIYREIQEQLKSLNLNVPNSLEDIFNLDKTDAAKILQIIVDKITESFIHFFHEKIHQKNDQDGYSLILLPSEKEINKFPLKSNEIVLQKSEAKIIKVHSLENKNIIKKTYDLNDDFKNLVFPDNNQIVTIDPKNDKDNLIGKIALLCGLTDFNTVIARLEGERFKEIFDSQSKQLNIQSEPVKFLKAIELQYPTLILKMHGHDLQFVYGRLFKKQLAIEFMFNFLEKEGVFISADLIDIFSDLLIAIEPRYNLNQINETEEGIEIKDLNNMEEAYSDEVNQTLPIAESKEFNPINLEIGITHSLEEIEPKHSQLEKLIKNIETNPPIQTSNTSYDFSLPLFSPLNDFNHPLKSTVSDERKEAYLSYSRAKTYFKKGDFEQANSLFINARMFFKDALKKEEDQNVKERIDKCVKKIKEHFLPQCKF